MSFLERTADQLLSVVVPRVTAAAVTCPPGWHRRTCGCAGNRWYDVCCDSSGHCNFPCFRTVWSC